MLTRKVAHAYAWVFILLKDKITVYSKIVS